jgi:hypothetical protein
MQRVVLLSCENGAPGPEWNKPPNHLISIPILKINKHQCYYRCYLNLVRYRRYFITAALSPTKKHRPTQVVLLYNNLELFFESTCA